MLFPDESTKLAHVLSLLDDITNELVNLPDQMSDRVGSKLQNIRSYLTDETFPSDEKRYRELAESINDGFFELNQDWNFTYVNQRAASNVGYRPEDLIGKNIWEIFPRVLGTIHETNYRLVMAQRQPASFETVGSITGKTYIIRVYPSANGITVFWIDITESKQIEEALARSNRKISEILSSIEDDFYVLDRDWKFVYANKQFTGKIGKEPEDFVGKNIWEMFPKHVGSTLYENFQASMEKGEIRRFELRGKYTEASYSMTSFPSAEGITVLGADITERIKVEEARNQILLQRRLMEQRELDRQSLARDLHDGPVQNLAGLLFNIQFAKEAFSDLAVQIELEKIGLGVRNTVQELRTFINEMRPPALIRFGLAKAIEVYLNDFIENTPEIAVNYSLTDDRECLSEQARLSLFRIFQEALANTVKHSRANHLDVTLQCDVRQITLEIRDDGAGFPFSGNLVDYSTNGHYGLIGMKERAEAVNATFQVSSAPGEGTAIKVIVPVNLPSSLDSSPN